MSESADMDDCVRATNTAVASRKLRACRDRMSAALDRMKGSAKNADWRAFEDADADFDTAARQFDIALVQLESAAVPGPAPAPVTALADEQIDALMRDIGRAVAGRILEPGLPMHGDWPVFYRAKVNAAIALATKAQQPVSAESRFTGMGWSPCSIEHARMVFAAPHEWQGYEARLLYTGPQKSATEFLPLLLRDLCRELGIEVPQAFAALREAGLGNTSQGTAVTPEMARVLRERFEGKAEAPATALRSMLQELLSTCAIDDGATGLVARAGDLLAGITDQAAAMADGWLPLHEAPKETGPVLLLVPTRYARRSTHLQVQGEWFGSYWVIFNADEALQRVEPIAWRPLYKHPLVAPAPVAVALPKEPPPGLLMSMAIRYDHGLGVPGYYDSLNAAGFSIGTTHAQRLESTLRTMSQLYEEVSGHGFYRPEREAEYAAKATRSNA